MNFSERYFHTGKIALNITEWKNQKINSPNLLLIHGFGVSKKTWDSSTLLLSKNYHLFSVDLRGMGKSGRITPPHSRFDWVTDINCLMNKEVSISPIIPNFSNKDILKQVKGWIKQWD